MQIKKYTFRKTIGGLSVMTAMLLLLIGISEYDQIFSSAKYDIIKSSRYAKTAIQEYQNKPKEEKHTFSLDDDGEIIKINERNDGEVIYHYRAVAVPELINNYEDIPELYLQIQKNNKKTWQKADIYKIDRAKGRLYFLLKLEKNHQMAFTNIYTGEYKVNLIH
jgi:hypothetical protein